MASFLLDLIWLAPTLLVVLWVAGAIYYDLCNASRIGLALMLSWMVIVALALLFWHPIWMPGVAVWVVGFVTYFWWSSLKPKQDREWHPNFSALANISVDGDVLKVENVRNSDYQDAKNFTTRYETRDYHLSRLQSVDALIYYWGSDWMCHPMFVFDFGEDGRMCISAEVRYRKGQEYGFVRSLYRQQELIFVVSDERDAILQRTEHYQGIDLYLYRLTTDPLRQRQFFFEYTVSINRLFKNPKWYNGLTANCTTGIYRQGRARIQWDWRFIFNGALDRMLYERGLLDNGVPFEELKKNSRVNEVAHQAPRERFGDYIRSALPGYRTQQKNSAGAKSTS